MFKKHPGILYILVFFIVVISGCEGQESTGAESDRPSNIPSTSIWVGGIDGGVFVSVKELDRTKTGMYFAEIYYISGDLAYKGAMRIFPTVSTFETTAKESYEGWDGDNLYLSNSRYLRVQE